MIKSKVVGLFLVFSWLSASMLLGCTIDQRPSANQSSPTSNAPTTEPDLAEGTGASSASVPVENGTAAQAAAENTSASPATGSAVVVLMAGPVTTLEPYQMVSIHPDGSVASHLWDTLTLLNNDLQIEPHLAESWRLVNNFTWEFKLREGIKFHNDEPVNAEAVRFSIERAQTMPGSLETFAEDVGLEQVEVVDELTLRLTTRQPIANLPYHLAFLEVLPPTYYMETSADELALAPIGSGPYRLAEIDQEGALVLEAVPNYWKGTPVISRLVFKTVPAAEERLAALGSGEATLVTNLPPTPADQWDIPESRLETVESTRRLFVGLHVQEDSSLADKRVRQAINYGVNVEEIVDNYLAGYGERYGSWVNPPANNPELAPWPYDPELARQLLTEAGYSEGLTLTLRTPADVYDQDVAIAEAIARQLGQIGLTVKVDPVKNWEVYVRELLGSNPTPLFLLELNSRGDGLQDMLNMSQSFAFNPTGWHNASFEEVAGRAIGTFNDNSRARLLNEAQVIARDEAPWIWLWRPYDFYGVSQSFDWTPRRDGLVYLYSSTTSSGGAN